MSDEKKIKYAPEWISKSEFVSLGYKNAILAVHLDHPPAILIPGPACKKNCKCFSAKEMPTFRKLIDEVYEFMRQNPKYEAVNKNKPVENDEKSN